MISCIVARVGPHSDILEIAKSSTCPVINALSDSYHPLQTIADLLTMYEALSFNSEVKDSSGTGLGLEGTKIAWIGDSNNVLYDLSIGAVKSGMHIAIATPEGYEVPSDMRKVIEDAGVEGGGQFLLETRRPEEAVKNADILVTDTWISMGQEEESKKRLAAFDGFQITSDLARRGGSKADWKFMHCLPRHAEEVTDEVFYGERSLVFAEAENRLWAAIGKFLPVNCFIGS